MTKQTADFTTTNAAGFPLFLIVSAAERAAAWERNPPKPMPVFGGDTTPKDTDRAAAYELVAAEKRAAADAKRESRPAVAPEAMFTVRPNVPMMTRSKYDRIMHELPDEAHRKVLRRMYEGALKANPKGVPILERAAPAKAERRASPRRGKVPVEQPKIPVESMSKPQRLVHMLTRPEGATLAEIGKTNGWELHTAGARISGVKLQYLVNKTEEPGRGTVYRAERK